MSLAMIPKEKHSVISGWIKLWEAAALLLFLHLLQSLGAKILKTRDRCFLVQLFHWWVPGSMDLGDAPSDTCVAHRVDEPLC